MLSACVEVSTSPGAEARTAKHPQPSDRRASRRRSKGREVGTRRMVRGGMRQAKEGVGRPPLAREGSGWHVALEGRLALEFIKQVDIKRVYAYAGSERSEAQLRIDTLCQAESDTVRPGTQWTLCKGG